MSVRALDGDGMARSVRTMAHPCKSANTTVIGREGWPMLGDGGTGCVGGWGGLGIEGFGGLR